MMAMISFSMSGRSNSFLVKLLPFLALVLCLSLTLQLPIVVARTLLSDAILFRTPNLVNACNDNVDCMSWIQDGRSKSDLESLKKADMKTVAFLALKKIEQEATNVSTTVRMKLMNASVSNLAPETQQALSDCNDHFVPAIEIIADAVDAVAMGSVVDAMNYYSTAITEFEVCYPRLLAMRDNSTSSVDENDYVDDHIEEVANARNALVKFIHIPLDILKVLAATSPH